MLTDFTRDTNTCPKKLSMKRGSILQIQSSSHDLTVGDPTVVHESTFVVVQPVEFPASLGRSKLSRELQRDFWPSRHTSESLAERLTYDKYMYMYVITYGAHVQVISTEKVVWPTA